MENEDLKKQESFIWHRPTDQEVVDTIQHLRKKGFDHTREGQLDAWINSFYPGITDLVFFKEMTPEEALAYHKKNHPPILL